MTGLPSSFGSPMLWLSQNSWRSLKPAACSSISSHANHSCSRYKATDLVDWAQTYQKQIAPTETSQVVRTLLLLLAWPLAHTSFFSIFAHDASPFARPVQQKAPFTGPVQQKVPFTGPAPKLFPRTAFCTTSLKLTSCSCRLTLGCARLSLTATSSFFFLVSDRCFLVLSTFDTD